MGFGGYDEISGQWFYGTWPELGPDFQKFHINAKEMWAAYLAVLLFYRKRCKGKSMKLFVDNQATEHCIKRGYSSSEQMLLPLITVYNKVR